MSGPITPQEALRAQQDLIPGEVFAVFNALIEENLDNDGVAVFRVDTAIENIREVLVIQRKDVHERGLLYVAPAYRAKGWKVRHRQPPFGYSWPADFVFEVPS